MDHHSASYRTPYCKFNSCSMAQKVGHPPPHPSKRATPSHPLKWPSGPRCTWGASVRVTFGMRFHVGGADVIGALGSLGFFLKKVPQQAIFGAFSPPTVLTDCVFASSPLVCVCVSPFAPPHLDSPPVSSRDTWPRWHTCQMGPTPLSATSPIHQTNSSPPLPARLTHRTSEAAPCWAHGPLPDR